MLLCILISPMATSKHSAAGKVVQVSSPGSSDSCSWAELHEIWMLYLGPVFPVSPIIFFLPSSADGRIFWEVLFCVIAKMPVYAYVKSLPHNKGLIILIITPGLPYFVLEMLTKEPTKPRSDNSNAKRSLIMRGGSFYPLWPTFSKTFIWSNSSCFLFIFLFPVWAAFSKNGAILSTSVYLNP